MKDTIKILSKPYYVKCIKKLGLEGYDKFGDKGNISINLDENLIAFKSHLPSSQIPEVITFIDPQYNLFFVSNPSLFQYFSIEEPISFTKQEIIDFVENKKYELI